MKGLLILQSQKPLSFREKKMLDRARHMLITEFSTSRGLAEPEAGEMLERALAKAQLRMPQKI
jgi:CarD family transcriptional regulator